MKKVTFYAVELDISGAGYETKLFADKEMAINAMTFAVWNLDKRVYLASLYKCKGVDYNATGERIAVWRRYGRFNDKIVENYEGKKVVEDESHAGLQWHDKIAFETTARVWAQN